MTILKEKIIEYMKEKNLSIAALERQAGLSTHAVRNIVKGRIKRPSAQSLQAIAKALECSLSDLMKQSPSRDEGAEKVINTIISKKKSVILDDIELMKECSQTILTLVKGRDKVLPIDDYLDILKTLYFYSSVEKIKKVDHKFAKWILSI
ncbi:MAG: helix-turn-helix transcriptional regulator [Alphaproteobacteria bacterium]|nr:helix-turn-helix transcriptional regulator [Alphaproteobacteria bacterium]